MTRAREGGFRGEQIEERIPRCDPYLTRVVVAQLEAQDIDPAPILAEAGIPEGALGEPDELITSRQQIVVLNAAAEALDDKFLGFHLALGVDLRTFGLLHYLMASAETLREALACQERYGVANEALRISDGKTDGISLELSFVGIERHLDRHQAEFWLASTLRHCRHLTGRELVPTAAAMVHSRAGPVPEMERFVGRKVSFGSDRDLLAFDREAGSLPLVTSDPYLQRLLSRLADKALADQFAEPEGLRTRVENAIMRRLRHGTATLDAIARDFGTSPRTLTRRLADGGANFSVILDELRHELALQYLRDNDATISQVTWMLGYREPSAAVRAFKRWTGKTPTELRRSLKAR